MWACQSILSFFTVTPFNIIHWQQVMEINFSFISSLSTTKVQNRIKWRCEMLPLLMLRPFENLLAIRGAMMLQGRITEQRDGGGIWNEVLELPSLSPPPSLLSWHPKKTLQFIPMPSKFCWNTHWFPSLMTIVALLFLVCGWVVAAADSLVHLSGEGREREVHSSQGSAAQSGQ